MGIVLLSPRAIKETTSITFLPEVKMKLFSFAATILAFSFAEKEDCELRKTVSKDVIKEKFVNDKDKKCAITGVKSCLQVDHIVEVQQADYCFQKTYDEEYFDNKGFDIFCSFVKDKWLNGKSISLTMLSNLFYYF